MIAMRGSPGGYWNRNNADQINAYSTFEFSTKPVIATQERLLNVKDVAGFLKVETAAVYAACNKGELPFIKIGKLYKFTKPDVLKWVDAQKDSLETKIDAYVNKYLQKHSLKDKGTHNHQLWNNLR